jgi:hypothetical protein
MDYQSGLQLFPISGDLHSLQHENVSVIGDPLPKYRMASVFFIRIDVHGISMFNMDQQLSDKKSPEGMI